MNKSILHKSVFIATLGFHSAFCSDTNGTWNIDGNGFWSDADTVNWNLDAVADGSGFTADFSTLDITADRIVSLAAPRTIGNLTFGDTATATAFGWTLDNNLTPANILTLAGTTPTITVNALGVVSGTQKIVTISTKVAGSAGLTKEGVGTLSLATSNTFSGGTVINGGTLAIADDSHLGDVPSLPTTANISINGGGKLLLGNNNNVTLSVNRGITVGSGMQSIIKWSRKTATINGVIAGTGGVNFDDNTALGADGGGGARFQINAANTYSGETTITFKGTKDPGIVLNNKFALQNTTVDYNNTNATSADLIWFSGGNTNYTEGFTFGGLKGNKTLNLSPQGQTAKNLRIGNNGQDTIFTGVIKSSNDTAAGITKIGNGTLTLGNACTYSGPTTVSAGTLALGATGSINNSSSVTIKPSAVLDTSAITAYSIPASPRTYTFQIDGTGSGSCGKIKAQGLNITTATIIFTEVTTPNDPAYVIAEYSSLTGANFLSATPPTGYTIDYAYAGGTQIALVSLTSSPYDDWAIAKGLTGLTGSGTDPAKEADPDRDGLTNSQEFAMDGNPMSGINDGKVMSKVATLPSDSSRVLTLSIPVRVGATFNGPGDLVSDLIDGLTYSIQGSDDLNDFTSMAITEITGTDATSVQSSLPPLSSAAWIYRSFRSPGSVNDGDSRDFLRIKVEQP